MQDRPEVVRRARSRLGEDRYHVLRNNCEHFCEWCVRGQNRSYQVDALVSRVGTGWLRFVEPFARIFRGQYVHHRRPTASTMAGRDREILRIGDTLWANEMITATAAGTRFSH